MATASVICAGCGGSGKCPKFQHIAGGVCFKCAGKGTRGTVDVRPSNATIDLARGCFRRLVAAHRADESTTEHADLLARAAVSARLDGDTVDAIATALARIDLSALERFRLSYGVYLASL